MFYHKDQTFDQRSLSNGNDIIISRHIVYVPKSNKDIIIIENSPN